MTETIEHKVKMSPDRVFFRLCAMFFVLGLGPGFWLPGLVNVLKTQGFSPGWSALVFLIFPISSMISPLFSGALADQKFAAEKLAGWITLISSVPMFTAFWSLHKQWPPIYFVSCFFVTAVISAPIWSLVTMVSLSHLSHPENQFPKVRLWATIGWILAGWGTSLVLHADNSPIAFLAGTCCRVILAISIFLLPHTPPQGVVRSWRSLLGFDAFQLLKEKDLRVYLIASCLLSMPLASFYMHTPEHLQSLHDTRATFTMSFGQWSEVVAMMITGWLMVRYRMKHLLLVGFGVCVLRFALFSWAGYSHQVALMWPGIAVHGICYTLFFITGQIFLDRRVSLEMRGQMQGLIGLFINGVGTLIGTFGLKILHQYTVEKSANWGMYWAVLTVFTAACMIWFAKAFHEKSPRDDAM